MCLYRGGNDSVAWHSDRIGGVLDEDTLVAIVSLGAARMLKLRCADDRRSLAFTLCSGDLLVMGGAFQRHWEHSVPKSARPVGPRLSVQFRSTGAA